MERQPLTQIGHKFHAIFRINHTMAYSMVIQNRPGNIQAQAAASAVSAAGFLYTVERGIDIDEILLMDKSPGVFHIEHIFL